ncbi:MAG TPA: helix-turn-helix domain-containing protein, partial [Candidatus Dormibacteraeota bacterium]|nr:helix-turn-helix domain-containing protein [Candidatus Dormibacteraeota bacterium]
MTQAATTPTPPPDAGFCPVHDAIQLLQEKWTLHVVRALLHGPRGFNELSRAVGGVNPATLAARLSHLESAGVVRKTVVSTMPPRTTYVLTDAGVQLQAVVDAID